MHELCSVPCTTSSITKCFTKKALLMLPPFHSLICAPEVCGETGKRKAKRNLMEFTKRIKPIVWLGKIRKQSWSVRVRLCASLHVYIAFYGLLHCGLMMLKIPITVTSFSLEKMKRKFIIFLLILCEWTFFSLWLYIYYCYYWAELEKGLSLLPLSSIHAAQKTYLT